MFAPEQDDPDMSVALEGRDSGAEFENGVIMRRLTVAARPLIVAWRYRELIAAVLRRELADRFSGSVLGWLWAVAVPLITLAIYVLTFTAAVHLPVASAQGGTSNYALSTFVGLIVFGLFSELCCRAPVLLHEHAWFLKSSIFPSEILAWIAVFRALTFAAIGLGVLLVFQLALEGTLQISLILLPLIIVPVSLLLLGMVWLLAALGAFTRDVSYMMTTFVSVAMIATPVFYRVTDLPPGMRIVVYINPLGAVIEMARAAILGEAAFPVLAYAGFCIVSLGVFRAGYAVFDRYRGILLDAI